MPIYEYRCEGCGHEMEAMQKMSDAPLSECPKCHKPTLTKLISAAGFRLKGSGWYQTDFKNSGGGGAKKGGEEKSESPKTESPKTEEKSAGCGHGVCSTCS